MRQDVCVSNVLSLKSENRLNQCTELWSISHQLALVMRSHIVIGATLNAELAASTNAMLPDFNLQILNQLPRKLPGALLSNLLLHLDYYWEYLVTQVTHTKQQPTNQMSAFIRTPSHPLLSTCHRLPDVSLVPEEVCLHRP